MPEKDVLQESFTSDLVPVVNPNPGFPDWVMVRDCQQVLMKAMKVRPMPPALAQQMISKATKAWAQMKNQVVEERRQILKCMAPDASPAVKTLVSEYAEVDDNGDVVLDEKGIPKTRTKAPPRPWLVRIDNPSGKKYYEEARKELEAQGQEVPAAYNPFRADEEHQQVIRMKRPDESWNIEDLRSYVKSNSGYMSMKDDEKMLMRKAQALFKADIEKFERLGMIVKVIGED